MPLSDYILYRLAKNRRSPAQAMIDQFGAEPGTDAYAIAYCQHQFDSKVQTGIQLAVTGKDVLEIACGRGGICCFLAVAGARRVVGIDVNVQSLGFAERFASEMSQRLGNGCRLPITFQEMDACHTTFADESFDVVVADKAFEHFTDPEGVMRESYRLLRRGGVLLVPFFSSIYSKYGLHVKHGLKLNLANVFFSEKTIIRAMRRLAVNNPKIYELYPGLADDPQRVRDLRPYKDLNDITYRQFRKMVDRVGFEVEWFHPIPTRPGWLVALTPLLRKSLLMDIFSKGAAACLRKPASA